MVEADLALAPGTDPAAAGAAVTSELCGDWEHAGPCRWPHNSAIEATGEPARFRTLFVAPPAEEAEVRERIEASLRAGAGWRVLAVRARAVARGEAELARRLLGAPRAR